MRALATRIHDLRRGAGLELEDVDLTFADGSTRRSVAIYTQDIAGVRDRFLTFAYVNGRSWRTLQNGLYALAPNHAERAEAA